MEEVHTIQVPDAREENRVTMNFGLDFAYHNWCYLQFEVYSIEFIRLIGSLSFIHLLVCHSLLQHMHPYFWVSRLKFLIGANKASISPCTSLAKLCTLSMPFASCLMLRLSSSDRYGSTCIPRKTMNKTRCLYTCCSLVLGMMWTLAEQKQVSVHIV